MGTMSIILFTYLRLAEARCYGIASQERILGR